MTPSEPLFGSRAALAAYGDPTPAPLASDDVDTHGMLVRFFEEWEMVTRTERELALRDRQYRDHDQWTAEERRILAERGQPELTINIIDEKALFLEGMERRLRSDPKANPRTPQSDDNGDAATQALRFVADDNHYDLIRSEVQSNRIVEGMGGVEVVVEPNQSGDYDVRVILVPYNRLWWDAHATKLDFTDARYMGSLQWQDMDVAEDTYPDGHAVLSATYGDAETTWATLADAPRMLWADTRRKRVMVVQAYWKQRGDWWMATFTKGGFLVAPSRSPYLDRHGKTCSPLHITAAFRDNENAHYGAVRGLIPMQDELNKRRSKALHEVNSKQIVAEEGAVADVDAARREIARPDGYIEVRPGMRFEILPNTSSSAGQMELLRDITARLDASGPNAAMAGKDPRELSGRAISLQQQGGSVQQEKLIDGLRQFDRRIYEAWWMRIRQFWTAERWIDVTDEDKNTRWVGLNRQVTLAEKLTEMEPMKRAALMQQLVIQPNDPRLQVVVEVRNDVDNMDVKIVADEAPDVATLQSEQFNGFKDLANLPLPIMTLLVKYSPFPKKGDMLKDLEQIQQQNAASVAQQQQHALQMEQAKIGLIQAQTQAQLAGAAQKQADAASQVHDMALEHAYVTAPDNAPPGHEMALSGVVGSSAPTTPSDPNALAAMPAPPATP